MGFFSLIVAVFIFLIGALAPLFNWDLGDFNPLMWGLFFFALGHVATGTFANLRNRL